MKIAVGMSGGVDSSVAAALVLQSSAAVGVTLRLYDGETDDNPCLKASVSNIADARAVCEKLGIEHTVLELKQQFREFVIDDFINEYNIGRTPNPCIQCNKYIKFGAMLRFALDNGFDKIATGHYAQIEYSGGKYYLKKARDLSKDQSYVLYNLTAEQLGQVEFPLGGYTKPQVRELAAEMGFVSAHKSDSQDICFVPDGDYAAFIESITNTAAKSGNYVDREGNILGRHRGLIHYTVGQRKGLGIAMGHPVFVCGKDAAANTVIIGDEDAVFTTRVEVEKVNFTAVNGISGDIRAAAKLRYRHTEQPCVIHPTSDSTVVLEFDKPQRAPAPGQSAVFYDGDYVLGGGIIRR